MSEHPTHQQANLALDRAKFNAFLMMNFERTKVNAKLVEVVTAEAKRYGVRIFRADGHSYKDELWPNVKHYMDACDLGIAVLDVGSQLNPNVSLEVGYMMAKAGQRDNGNKILFLKERKLERLSSDLVGKLYEEFDSDNLEESLHNAIERWLRNLKIAKGNGESICLFVSHGGQDRCAMAKVIAYQAFGRRQPTFDPRFESMAADYRGKDKSSPLARKVIKNHYKRDLLASHRVMEPSPGMTADANLILVMEEWFITDPKLARLFPVDKTHLLKQFFGKSGDVTDPWRPRKEEEREEDFQVCLDELRSLIEGNPEKLMGAMDPESDSKCAIALRSPPVLVPEALKLCGRARCEACGVDYGLYLKATRAKMLSESAIVGEGQEWSEMLSHWLVKCKEHNGLHPYKIVIPDYLAGPAS